MRGYYTPPIPAGLRSSQSVVRDRDETQEGSQKCQEDSVQLVALKVEEETLESGNVSGFRKLKSGNRFSIEFHKGPQSCRTCFDFSSVELLASIMVT